MMGDGYAVEPSNGKVYAPVNGKVTSVLKQNMPLVFFLMRGWKYSFTWD